MLLDGSANLDSDVQVGPSTQKVSKKPTARFELGKDFGTSDRKTNLTKLLFIKVKGGTCQHQLWGLEQLGTETTTEAKNDQTTQQHSGRTETGRPVNGIV